MNWQDQMELAELKDHAKVAAEQIHAKTRSLTHYWNRQRQLTNEIAQTHKSVKSTRNPGRLIVIAFNLSPQTCTTRANIFPELDCLNAQHRPQLDELATFRRIHHGLQQRINALKKMLQKGDK